MKKIIFLFVLLLFTLSLTPGCFFKQATTSPEPTNLPSGKGTLNLYSIDPLTLDPAIASEMSSHEYIGQIFSGLIQVGENLEPAPDIAQSLPDISPDGLTYTFYLRKDVRFHTGRQVTAADFKYSWERAASPATGSQTAATYLGDIVGVKEMLAGKANQISGLKVLDDFTLEVKIDSPKSYGSVTFIV